MQDEKRPLIMELAHVLHRRNMIEVRRRRAKSKIGYYEAIKRDLKQFKTLQSQAVSWKHEIGTYKHSGRLAAALAAKESLEGLDKRMESLNHPKWMGKVSELNKLILKYKAEYMVARYDTARLTCQTRKRVSRLTKLLNCFIDYQMGTAFVAAIGFRDPQMERIGHEQFEAMYREVDANKAIEKALRASK